MTGRSRLEEAETKARPNLWTEAKLEVTLVIFSPLKFLLGGVLFCPLGRGFRQPQAENRNNYKPKSKRPPPRALFFEFPLALVQTGNPLLCKLNSLIALWRSCALAARVGFWVGARWQSAAFLLSL